MDAKKKLENVYKLEAHNSKGELLWAEKIFNLVTTEGLNDSLDKHLKGASYTAAWYVGLTTGSPTAAAADTLTSHSGWTECADYTGNRQAITFGSASNGSISNSSNKNTFTINDSCTIGGAFICNSATGTNGILYGVGAFSAGNKSLSSGDTLSVTVTCQASAA